MDSFIWRLAEWHFFFKDSFLGKKFEGKKNSSDNGSPSKTTFSLKKIYSSNTKTRIVSFHVSLEMG
jgi:hypothetical protein